MNPALQFVMMMTTMMMEVIPWECVCVVETGGSGVWRARGQWSEGSLVDRTSHPKHWLERRRRRRRRGGVRRLPPDSLLHWGRRQTVKVW